MKGWILMALALSASASVGAAAGWAGTSHPTRVSYDGLVELQGDTALVTGHLATRRACRKQRTVKLKAVYADRPTKVVDVDVTSRRGAWALKAKLKRVSQFKVVATRDVRGSGDRRTVCEAGRVTIPLA